MTGSKAASAFCGGIEMAVSIQKAGQPVPRRSCNAHRGFMRRVRELAPLIVSMQSENYVSPREIASALSEVGYRNGAGRPHSEATIRRMIIAAKELGFPVVHRSRSDAQAASWTQFGARNRGR